MEAYQELYTGPVGCAETALKRTIRMKSSRFQETELGAVLQAEAQGKGTELCHVSEILSRTLQSLQGEVWLSCVQPIDEQKRILHARHVDPTAGHLGREKTLYRIKEQFTWCGMCSVASRCLACSWLTYLCMHPHVLPCSCKNVMYASTCRAVGTATVTTVLTVALFVSKKRRGF